MDMPKEPRIMVVDDDAQELDRTLDAIRRHGLGYEARIALGGFEALDYLLGRGRFHERRRHPLPDLILLDLGMDPLDGVAVVDIAHPFEHLRRIPLAVLCKTQQERERAMRKIEAAYAYPSKPLTPESFHDVLLQAVPWALESKQANGR
jgi:CheY-like chemotaxis protein